MSSSNRNAGRRASRLALAAAWIAVAPACGWSDGAAADYNRGIAHLASNRYDEAVAAFEEAARAGPAGDSRPIYNAALSHFRARRFDRALAVLERIRGFPAAAVLRARALRSLGRKDDSLAAWEAAREEGVLRPAGLWHYARLLDLYGLPQRRLEVLESLAQSSDEDAVVVELADALARAGRAGEALAALERAAARMAPERADLRAALSSPGTAGAEAARVANLLRALPSYARGIYRIEHGAGSGVADEPLPLHLPPASGPAPFAGLSAPSPSISAPAPGDCAATEWLCGSPATAGRGASSAAPTAPGPRTATWKPRRGTAWPWPSTATGTGSSCC